MTSDVKDWMAILDSRNVVDFTMEIEAGTILDFSVNYRAHVGGEWVEVVRYDTAHGHLHVHTNWREEDAITPLENPEDPDPPYNEAFTKAEEDLKANWRTYRRKMERKVLADD